MLRVKSLELGVMSLGFRVLGQGLSAKRLRVLGLGLRV